MGFRRRNILKDDRLLNQRSYLTSNKNVNAHTVQTNESVINVYPLLGAEKFSRARGFPLAHIKEKAKIPHYVDLTRETIPAARVGVVQALANVDPDVDAIYRLQRKLRFQFTGLAEQNIFALPELPSQFF